MRGGGRGGSGSGGGGSGIGGRDWIGGGTLVFRYDRVDFPTTSPTCTRTLKNLSQRGWGVGGCTVKWGGEGEEGIG